MPSLHLVGCIAIIVLSSGKFHHPICLSSRLISCSKPGAFPKHSIPLVFQYTDTHTYCITEGWRKKLSLLIYFKSLFLETEGEVRQQSAANIVPCRCAVAVSPTVPLPAMPFPFLPDPAHVLLHRLTQLTRLAMGCSLISRG